MSGEKRPLPNPSEGRFPNEPNGNAIFDLNRREVVVGLVGVSLGVTLPIGCHRPSRTDGTSAKSWIHGLPETRRTAFVAAVDCLFPGAVAAGAIAFIDYWLTRPPLRSLQHHFDLGSVLITRKALERYRRPFTQCTLEQQETVLREVAATQHRKFDGAKFIERLLTIIFESFLGDPKYGGNRNQVGWQLIGRQPCWWAPVHAQPLIDRAASLPY